MGPERTYQTKLIGQLRERGAWVVKYPAGPHGTIGTPDLLVCHLGHFIALEVKAGDPRLKAYAPTVMQQQQLDAIMEAGGIAVIAWPGNAENIMALLDAVERLDAAVGTRLAR